jgi:hypothetical protein
MEGFCEDDEGRGERNMAPSKPLRSPPKPPGQRARTVAAQDSKDHADRTKEEQIKSRSGSL